jgi:hypothetical protein
VARSPSTPSPSTAWRWATVLLLLTSLAHAAERSFDFASETVGQPPRDFLGTLTGDGPPGKWQIIDDLAETQAGQPRSSVPIQHPVLAQLSSDPTDERFPLLIFQPEVFGDFSFTTRFKTVAGQTEQMAGVAFRYQDERNYYVVRASSLGNSFVFYKFVDGIRSNPIGVQTAIPTNTWHELTVECLGNEIRCRLNGRELFPTLTDNSFTEGRIGFWTKSDSISYFRDARIVYTPRDPPAKTLVREIMTRYPRLVGVKICAPPSPGSPPRILASSNPDEVGQPGTEVDHDVLAQGAIFYGKDKKTSEVAMPLRDRNGDPIASVRVLLDRFPGQTEANALARAQPILEYLQHRILTARDLTQ